MFITSMAQEYNTHKDPSQALQRSISQDDTLSASFCRSERASRAKQTEKL